MSQSSLGQQRGSGKIALKLVKDGFDLGLFDLPRSQQKLNDVAERVKNEFGSKVVNVLADVSNEEDVKRLVETVVGELGSLYAMIANAGNCRKGALHDTSTVVFEREFNVNVNVKGTFLSYKYAAIQLMEQGTGGRLLGAASNASKRGYAQHAACCMSKFAVRGLTQSAACDYGKYGLTVNAYAPGPTESAMLDGLDEYYTKQKGTPKGSWASAIPNLLGRVGKPEDIANLVSFLVSEEAAFITGQSYTVDGESFLTEHDLHATNVLPGRVG
ncbi:acetoin reductase family protein [Daedaleopsis nitida]|nr:acetoin reductase family protein [Daedaleopsis nitida]